MSHRRTLLFGLAGLSVAVALSGGANAGGKHKKDLTPEAATAVKELFPNAQIVAVGHEREQGVFFFEVALLDADKRYEVEVAADGTIGEIETVVSADQVPAAAMDGLVKLSGGASPTTVERHEVLGLAKDGTFVAVRPTVYYEAAEVAVALDGSPVAVEDEKDVRDHDGKGDHSSDGDHGSDSSD